MRVAKCRTSKGVHYEIKVPVHISILLYQEKGWKTPTGPRLPETK